MGATLAFPAISLWRLTVQPCGGGVVSLRDLGAQRRCRRGGGVAVAGLRPRSASPSLHQSLRSAILRLFLLPLRAAGPRLCPESRR